MLNIGIGVVMLVAGILLVLSDLPEADGGWILVAIGSFSLLVGLLGRLGKSAEAHLMTDGRFGTVQVLKVRDTGVYVNERPRLELDLRFQPQDGDAYDLQVKRAVGPDMIGRIQPGAVLPVRLDPDGNRKFWAFDRDAPAQLTSHPAGHLLDGAALADSPASSAGLTDELERLAALHRQGALSDDEFASAKRRLLDQG